MVVFHVRAHARIPIAYWVDRRLICLAFLTSDSASEVRSTLQNSFKLRFSSFLEALLGTQQAYGIEGLAFF